MPNSEEIKQQIKILEEKLHEANIREGNVNLAQEVKKRILNLVPDFPNIDYVLWPIRIFGNGETKTRKYSPRNKVVSWDDPVLDQRLLEGKHDELVAEYGMTWASIRSRANKLGYKFRKNKPLKKKEVA